MPGLERNPQQTRYPMRRARFSILFAALLCLVAPLAGRGQTAPANDDLANAQLVTGSNFVVDGDDEYATTEPGEPAADGSRTIWYLWTAPANLYATLATSATSAGTVLNVYQVSGTGAPTYGQFVYVASNSSGNTTSASVSFPAAANTTFAICVGTYSYTGTNGAVALSLASTPGDPTWAGPVQPAANVPPNDNLADAQLLSGTQAAAVGYNGAATTEAGEPAGDGYDTIWYVWTAPANLNVTLATGASSPGTVVSAYQVSSTGAPGYGQFVYVASASTGGTSASITFPVTANATYAIAVGSETAATDNGAVILSLSSTPGLASWAGSPSPTSVYPPNDDLAGAQMLSGTEFAVVGYNGSATTEADEPAADGKDTIWYVWTAPSNLTVTVSTNASSSGTILNAYQVSGTGAPSYSQFNYIRGNGSGAFSTSVTFPVTANTTYAFAVGSIYTLTNNGAVILSMTSSALGLAGPVFRPPPPTGVTPANDDFANALVIHDSEFYALSYGATATTETGEPSSTGYHTLWYSWTPRESGLTTVETVYADYSHQISIFSGTSVATATRVTPTVFGQPGNGEVLAMVSLDVKANITYHIAIGSQDPGSLEGALIMQVLAPGNNVFPNAGRFIGFLDAGQDDYIELTVSSSGAVSGKAIVGGEVIKLGGAFNLSGDYSKIESGVDIQLYLDPTGVSSTMTGSVTADSVTYPVSFDGIAYSSTNPPPAPRRFTVLIPPDPSAGPAGYGAGTLSILTEGSLTFAGRLADGTVFSTSGWISDSGTWVLYLPLYGNAGRLTGLITFQQIAGVSDFSGTVTWVKPTTTKSPGFTAGATMVGSVYTAQRPALDLPNPPTAFFTSGGLASEAEYPGLVQVGGSVRATGLSLTFSKGSGVITGTFKPPGATRSLHVYGVAFQDQGMAAGYFLGPVLPGCFVFGD